VTKTSTPSCTTVTTSVQSTGTTTSISTSVVYSVTTVYPIQAISTTSTCALGATIIPNAATKKAKRGIPQPSPCTTVKDYTPPPIGTPTCLTKFVGPSLTSACSCLSISTPTTTSIIATTLAQQTVGPFFVYEWMENKTNASLDHKGHRRSTCYCYRDVYYYDYFIHLDILCYAILHEHIYHLAVSIQHQQLRRRIFIR
jgi:hypothetical protein